PTPIPQLPSPTMARPRFLRELALKVLFQIDVGRLPPDEVLPLAFEEVPVPEEQQRFVEQMVRGVLEEQAELDRIIGDLAEGWRVERLANVDKNVLRMALHELRHRPEVPASRVIDHAVEMAKKYSTAESGRFVNGVLGGYLRRQRSGK